MADVQISIGQTGAESTASAIGKVGESAKQTGKGTEAMGAHMGETLHTAHRLEGGLNQVERAMGETTAGAHLMGGGLRVIAQGMKALLLGGPQLIITGAIIALGAAINAIMGHFDELKKKEEENKKAAEDHAKALGELDSMKFTALVKQYEDVQKAADAAADASDRLLSAQMKLLSAQEKQQVAGIEARASAAIAALPQDENYEQNKQAIEMQKVRDVADVQTEYANKQADMEVLQAKQKQAKVLEDIARANAERLAVQQKLDEASAERQTLMLSHFKQPQNAATEQVYQTRKADLEKQIIEMEEKVRTLYAAEKKVANEAGVAGIDVQAAETTRGATQLGGIAKGMGTVAANNEIITKDYQPLMDASNAGNMQMATFIAQFNEFTMHNTETWKRLNDQLAKHNDILKTNATSQQ